eukprot:CAMPEP_0201555562 /NCGR_PEP_ID=MMETSP0173_2-20130828/49808_1 /ASSEMBLY_ACC=CAM_ASM_000268 /TAXON_ID=218659 /ORGANISM="Vexillifera sp., Strain DIVA3 564/2" /LENGTH=267 /DNA_ID=CAMNT_0047967417 /DNA_START=457 /DNA_END=1257 /DNA_ORIENTATION=-
MPIAIRVASQTGLYISISLVLLCVDLSVVKDIIGPSIGVAWIDTPILFVCFSAVGFYLLKIDLHLSILLSGAAVICGTSAAIALATVVSRDSPHDVDIPIAIISIFTVPAIVGLPYAARALGFGMEEAGAWFGGCIDSTGGTLAASSLFGGKLTQETTAIVKMLQNILIAPIAIGTTFFWVWYLSKHPERASDVIANEKSALLVQNVSVSSSDEDEVEMERVQSNPARKSGLEWFDLAWKLFPKFTIGFVVFGLIFFNTFIPEKERD